jgi:hypothetical protein
MADDVVGSVEQAVARQILLGLRESLTIAGQLGRPVEDVNDALASLQDAGDGCIALMRPYPSEPRVVVTIVDWVRLRHSAQAPEGAQVSPPPASTHHSEGPPTCETGSTYPLLSMATRSIASISPGPMARLPTGPDAIIGCIPCRNDQVPLESIMSVSSSVAVRRNEIPSSQGFGLRGGESCGGVKVAYLDSGHMETDRAELRRPISVPLLTSLLRVPVLSGHSALMLLFLLARLLSSG